MKYLHILKNLAILLLSHGIKKGTKFTKKRLGHKSMAMTDKYLDSRNNEHVEL